MDKGPLWIALDPDHVWCLQSDDFKHDVRLYIGGDFRDKDQLKEYAEWLAAKLNGGDAPHVEGRRHD